MSEETTKYQKEWDTIKARKADGCIVAMFLIPIIAVGIYIARNYPDYQNAITTGFVLVFLVFALISLYSESSSTFDCPQCSLNFDRHIRTFPTNKCIHCKLPIYYGSSYFFDYWGREEGNRLSQEIKSQNQNK
jgi:hypothetical protein